MTKRTQTPHDHGILDERVLDRRRFLAHLGAGALGAAFLSISDAATGLAGLVEGPAATSTGASTAARPIHMIALGDSVMWGQGLADDQKFQTKIERWVASTNPQRRQVRRWNFAHSGATIGGVNMPHNSSGQMTAAVFGRLASANRGRDFEDMPELDPRGLGDTSRVAPRPATSGSSDHGRPNEPRAGDTLGGEIPRSFPSLWRQLDLALETLRTGVDPRNPKSGRTQPVDPAEVDLILLDGGANDIDFLGTIANFDRGATETYAYVKGIVEPRIKAYLPKVLEAFPNATIVLTTVYQGISMRSSPAMLTPLVQLGIAAAALVSPVGAFVGGQIAGNQIPGLVARNDAMERAIRDAYRAAVAAAPRNRVHIVSPAFTEANAYGAPQSFLFHLEDTDPAERGRHAECNALLGQWVNDTFVTARTSMVDTPLWVLCRDASTFHPNVAGANHYFLKIRDTLMKASPAFMRPLPSLRIVVDGSTAGETKTVKVSAFDAQTGRPVQGTVSVAGVTGSTGTAITYQTAACAVGDAASTPTPVPADAGGRAGPVRRPLPRGRTAPAVAVAAPVCAGSVTAEGYSSATFSY